MPAFVVACLVLWISASVSSSNSSLNVRECFKPCDNFTDGSCFTYGCKRVRLQTECILTSTAFANDAPSVPHCLSPGLVPGFRNFCQDVLDTWATPSDIQAKETTTTGTQTVKDESVGKLDPGEVCYGSTVLVSVAIGSFALGCSLTLILLCFCRFFKPCSKPKNPEDRPKTGHAIVGWEAGRRGLNPQGSTSSALLIQEASSENLSPGPSTLPTAPRPSPNGTVHGDVCRFKYPVGLTRVKIALPTPDPIYAAASESSSRDYQSIQCESENPYVLNSECGSDYSTTWPAFDRLNYRGENDSHVNDYSSLGQKNNNAHACPTSECSGKDYTSLLGDRFDLDIRGNASISEYQTKGATGFTSTNFQVNDLNFPNRGIQGDHLLYDASNLRGDSQGPKRKPIAEKDTRTNGLRNTLADLMPERTITETEGEPHEYFILEPVHTKP